jgi:hypothetical protein
LVIGAAAASALGADAQQGEGLPSGAHADEADPNALL